MLPLVCCRLLPRALAEEWQVDAAAVSNSTASLLTVIKEDACRTKEDPIRALEFHTPIYPLSCFPCSVEWNFGLLYG